MTSLHSLLDFVESNEISKKDMEAILGSISNNLQQTTQMFNNIMHWARSQFDSYEPDIVQVDLCEITEELNDEFMWQFKEKGVDITNNIDEGTNVMADKDMLTIVLRNLVSNALKFCEEYDSVTITTETQQDEVAISVIDTGIGIDEEEQEKIFSNENYSSRGTENESGSGFGLKICREFVEMNNGKIRINGNHGEGTTVTITLPAAKETAHFPVEEREEV